MKKLAIMLSMVFIAFISCKQSNFEQIQDEYGTVVFDLTGNSNLRDINSSTGLPDLASSKIKIIIEVNNQRPEIKEFGESERKQYKGRFLVGTKIKFTAIVNTKGGKWKGNTELTVVSGTNSLNLKLKKAVAALEPLKFRLYRDETIASNVVQRFSLGFFDEEPFFKEGDKDVEVSASEYVTKAPSFCRDNKGRIYVFYKGKDETDTKMSIKRYTSDGIEDVSFAYEESGARPKTNLVIISDQKTGLVFASYRNTMTAQTELLLVQEGKPGTLKSITPTVPMKDVFAISVYNGVFSTVEWDSGYKIRLYKYNDDATPVLKIGEETINEDLLDMHVEGNEFKPVKTEHFVDSFMNDKNIYLLYRNADGSGYVVSTGGILKCEYTIEGRFVTIKDVKRFIAKDKYKADDHNIINVKAEDETKEFYGPLGFVGFNEDVLYIADDGTVREYEVGTVQVLENKNRLVHFNLKNETISIEKPSTETWLPETKAIEKTNPTVFFSYKIEGTNRVAEIKLYDGNKFFNFDNNSQILRMENPNSELIYAIDSSGSFYLLHQNTGNPDKLEKYTPYKTQSGIVYERSMLKLNDDVNNGTEHITSLYYDIKRKGFYYIAKNTDRNLYRRDGNEWKKITRGNYTFKPEAMAIYDGRVWAYNVNPLGVAKIENIGIMEGNKLEDSATEFNLPTELSSTRVLGLSVYKGILYFLYSDSEDKVFALAVEKDDFSKKRKTNEPIFGLKSDSQNIKPIGFDERGGLKFPIDDTIVDYDGRIEANVNKYFSLKYEDVALAKVYDLPSKDAATWYVEKHVWQGTNDIMLWSNSGSTSNKAKYFAVSETTIPSELEPATASIEGDVSNYDVCNKFCYDQFGNLYVLIKKGGDYYVVRFRLTEEGKYNFKELNDKIKDSSFDNWEAKFEVSSPSFEFSDFVMAVYADNPDSGVLYYRMFDAPTQIAIKKHSFVDGKFNDGIGSAWLDVSSEYTPVASTSYPNPLPVERQFMAMAANKDGVFIALKELEYPAGVNNKYYKNYNVEMRKYPHDNPIYESPVKRVDIVGKGGTMDENNTITSPWERVPTNMFDDYTVGSGLNDDNAQWDQYTVESITDMYAYNGVLYALSYKEVGGKGFPTEDNLKDPVFKNTIVSGTLWKMGKTDAFEGSATPVATSESLKANPVAKFAPCHIIGVLPKKIVIASDGYHGFLIKGGDNNGKQQGDNYDFVYFLNTENSKLNETETKKTAIRFNLKIKHYTDGELATTLPSTSAFAWE